MLFARSLRPTEFAVRVQPRVVAELCRSWMQRCLVHRNLSDAAWTQSSAYRFSSQGTTQSNCGAPADSRGSCLGAGRYDAKPGRLGVIVKAKVCDSQIVKATTVAFSQRTGTDLLLIMKSRTCAGGQAQNGLVSIWRSLAYSQHRFELEKTSLLLP